MPEARSGATSPSPAAGTLFFGESNFLTLVPGERACNAQSGNRQRLMFPAPDTPQSQGEGSGVSAATMQYLRDEGALTLPDLHTCVPALQAFFKWFHPCFPIVDRADVMRSLATMDISRMLLQSMLFIGATYCDDETITAMGFADRSEAKNLLYGRARILFHADWEKDRMTLIQSLFLISFWRGGPSDPRDVRYWLGVVITLAESHGLHRSWVYPPCLTLHLFTMVQRKVHVQEPASLQDTKEDVVVHLRSSNFRLRGDASSPENQVRERQAAASLGLPSRIRDEDCDIEPLSAADLESETEVTVNSLFGSCQPQHITYVIKMVEIARLCQFSRASQFLHERLTFFTVGRVIDVHFVPGQHPATSDHILILDISLKEWKNSLPSDMQYSEEGSATIWTCLLHLAYK